ncbi:hypothetical protein [Actinoallomurus soli]|uniref:hypothetical protein n=1 Tax=Actinoallomurus soli TaxID=2952535 RepID=UPI002093163D|nr:hypothetical protein [Actinoallomurus soli]MCO5968648.1 hypothetical protein [Actinoallomurus soli]
MEHPERSRRRRRDAGLHQVTVWTRRAVGVGVVLSGLLAAGLAHLLPGQAADRTHADPAAPTSSEQPATPPDDSAGPAASTGSSASARPHRTHRHHLTPPATAPAAPPSTPARRPTHVTSGGS